MQGSPDRRRPVDAPARPVRSPLSRPTLTLSGSALGPGDRRTPAERRADWLLALLAAARGFALSLAALLWLGGRP